MAVLNVRHLQIFRAVVKSGSVTGAGRLLHISQPAVTKALRLLEEELGLTLFYRSGGRLVSTPEADALLPEVDRLFGNLDSVKQVATEIRYGIRGSLTIAASSTIAISALTRSVGLFYQKHPRVTIDLRALPTRHVVEYVNTNQADLGVLDVPALAADLRAESFCQSQLVCIMRRDHPFAQRGVLTPQDLADQLLITFGENTLTNLNVREAFRACGVPFNVGFATNSTITACSLVSELSGIALVDPFSLLSGAFPHLTARRFEPTIGVHPHFLFSNRPRSLIVTEFVRQVTDAVRDMEAELDRMMAG